MKARLLKAGKVKELQDNIHKNLANYRSGNFDFVDADGSAYIEVDFEIDFNKLSEIDGNASEAQEVQNCKRIFEAFPELSKYLARDERLWVYLCHTHLLEYARKRWPIPQDDAAAVKYIRDHFFVTGGQRGFERLNAASRLWWMAMLCKRVQGMTFDQALETLLRNTDVRANIIERPTTSQSVEVFSALLKKFDASHKAGTKLWVRENYRAAMKDLNLLGGVFLLESVPEETIYSVLDNHME